MCTLVLHHYTVIYIVMSERLWYISPYRYIVHSSSMPAHTECILFSIHKPFPAWSCDVGAACHPQTAARRPTESASEQWKFNVHKTYKDDTYVRQPACEMHHSRTDFAGFATTYFYSILILFFADLTFTHNINTINWHENHSPYAKTS